MFKKLIRKIGGTGESSDSGGRANIYLFELIAPEPIVIDEPRVLAGLTAELGQIQPSDSDGLHHYLLRDFEITYEDGQLPGTARDHASSLWQAKLEEDGCR